MKYFRLPEGPAPQAMLPVRTAMIMEGALLEVSRETTKGMTQKRLVATREADARIFSKAELGIVEEVVAELWDQTAKQCSDASHDIRWAVLKHKDAIPYDFVALANDPVDDALIARTRELAAKHGWR